MGLDSMWTPPKGSEQLHPAVFEPRLRLCIGLFADGPSFRGKVYADFFRDMIGVDLYEDLDNKIVRWTAGQLEGYLQHNPGEQCGVTVAEATDLARMFRVYGNMGCSLTAWY